EEQAGAAGRSAMDDARNRAALFGLYDEHVAAVALGDDLILQVLRRFLAAQIRLQRAAEPCALLPQAFANALQRRARVVHDVAGRLNLFAGVSGFDLERGGRAARGLEDWERSRRPPDGGARLVHRIEKRGERQQ